MNATIVFMAILPKEINGILNEYDTIRQDVFQRDV